jgi:hypothetical protein
MADPEHRPCADPSCDCDGPAPAAKPIPPMTFIRAAYQEAMAQRDKGIMKRVDEALAHALVRATAGSKSARFRVGATTIKADQVAPLVCARLVELGFTAEVTGERSGDLINIAGWAEPEVTA